MNKVASSAVGCLNRKKQLQPFIFKIHLLPLSNYRVFQKLVPIVNCILHKAFNASLGKCTLIQSRNLSK